MDKRLKEVGLRIRDARKARNISQADMADRLGISISHMSDIENGKTNYGVDILMRITENLQISADELLRTDIPSVDKVYMAEINDIFKDCSVQEKEAMLKTLNNMKEAFSSVK